MKKRILSVFILLVFFSILAFADEFVKVGANTKALYANSTMNMDMAIYWAMLTAADYNSDFYDFDVDILNKAEFTKLPVDIFGDAISALAKQKYALALVNAQNFEQILCIRLTTGEYLVVSVEEIDE